jgi:hypothetical protein
MKEKLGTGSWEQDYLACEKVLTTHSLFNKIFIQID